MAKAKTSTATKTTKEKKRTLRPRLTNEQKKKIDELRKAGKKASEIVKALGIKEYQLKYYVKTLKKIGKRVTTPTSQTNLDNIYKKLQKAENDVVFYKKILAEAVKKENNRREQALKKKYGVK